MRSEQRIGRPFILDSAIEASLGEVILEYPDGSMHDARSNGLVTPPKNLAGNSKLRLAVTLDLAVLNEALDRQELKPENVSIFIVAGISRLRRSAILSEIKLSEISKATTYVDLENGPMWFREALLSSRVSLSAYLCLSKSLSAQPLRPYLRSTWLSRAKFEIGTAEPDYSVTIQPLTDEQYGMGVPRGAYCWFEFKGDVTEAPSSEFRVTVFLDADVFSALKQYETSPASLNAQAKLEALVFESLLRRVVADCNKASLGPSDWLDLEQQDPPPALVNIVRNVAKSASREPAEFFELLLTDAELAMTHVGKYLKLVKLDVDLLKPLSEEVDS